MSLISRLSVRLQNHPKRVVFPEGADPRIIQAARQFATRKLGVPILLVCEEAQRYLPREEGAGGRPGFTVQDPGGGRDIRA